MIRLVLTLLALLAGVLLLAAMGWLLWQLVTGVLSLAGSVVLGGLLLAGGVWAFRRLSS